MKDDWVDPRDAKFFAELKRLRKKAREGQISKDTSQRGANTSSLKKNFNTKVLGASATLGLAIAGLAFWYFRRRKGSKKEERK